MKTLLQFVVIAALCLPACGQVFVCNEGCTITAISSPTAILQFGAGTIWNKITAPKLPLLVDCSSACPQLGGDPAQGIVKSIFAVQQATAYTVTLSNGTKVPIPAIPPAFTTYLFSCSATASVPTGQMPTALPLTGVICTAVKK